MAYVDTADPIARMNAAKDARRHRGLGSASAVPFNSVPVVAGEQTERRQLMTALALIAAHPFGNSGAVDTAHFARMDNDELREFIEAQFDMIAAAT
jgi:hypothetical protein